MSKNKTLKIGLFGFGVVGEGIYHVLNQTGSLDSEVKKICIKHADKQRNAPCELFTTHAQELLEDPGINTIVELIDDAEEAHHIVIKAMNNKKNVVSANKKLISQHLEELIRVSRENDVSFLYEAAVCGSIPVIRNLEEYYDNDWLSGFSGIINGSTNFILTQMRSHDLAFSEALKLAQERGFAESNPDIDIRGYDAANKLAILLAHTYGKYWHPEAILLKGIQSVTTDDFQYAREKGLNIKLVAQSFIRGDEITPLVMPTFVRPESPLYRIDNEYNGVLLKSQFADEQFLYGKGAGRYPTSSAVLSDLSALRYGYKYEYRKSQASRPLELTYQLNGKFFVSYPSEKAFDESVFETIDSMFKSRKRDYIIGSIKLEQLKDSSLISRPDVSVIFFDEIGECEQDIALTTEESVRYRL